MTVSASTSRAITATKNGRGVEQDGRDRRPGAGGRLGEAGERERRAAEAHRGGEAPEARSVRGSRAPNARRNGSSSRKPNMPRAKAVKAGVVWRSAVSVTLNAAPQKTIVKSSSSGTGMRAPSPLTDA